MYNYLSRRWFFLLVMIGLCLVAKYPTWTDASIKPLSTQWLTATTLFLMAVSLRGSNLKEALTRPGPALTAIGICVLVAPFLALGIAQLTLTRDYRTGLIIVGCLPCTLASAAVWTRLAGGNDAVALTVTFCTNLFAGITTPLLLQWLLQHETALPTRQLILDCVYFVTIPVMIGQLVRLIGPIGKLADSQKKQIGVVCRLLILVLIVKAAIRVRDQMAEKTESIIDQRLALVVLTCIGLHLMLWFLGYRLGKRLFERADAIAMSFAGSQKTLPVGILIVEQFFEKESLAIVPILFYHVCQLLIDTYLAEYLFTHTKAGKPGEFVENRIEVLVSDPPVES